MRLSEVAKAASNDRNKRRDAYAGAAGVGSVAAGAGLVAGGIPGMKDPDSDWGRMKQVKKLPRSRADLKESGKHFGAAGKGGILGYRVAAHKHELRMADQDNWNVSHHGETTHHGHYGRGVGYGKPHNEKIIIRQMSRGRKLANRTAIGGAAVAGAGLLGLKGREMNPRTRGQRSEDRKRATGTGLMAGGGAAAVGGYGGASFLDRQGKKWARYSRAKNRAAEKMTPGIGGFTPKKEKGNRVPGVSPDVRDDKMHTRPNAFVGRTKAQAERAGALRGQAAQGGYFGRVYGRTAKVLRRTAVPAGIAAAGAGAAMNYKQRHDQQKQSYLKARNGRRVA